MAILHSVLILGPDAVAAASPGTAVQLVHACHRWGFQTVIPASWGDELLAAEAIRRCSVRDNRPAIQCACPRVAERLGVNAVKLDDSIFWMTTPPVAAARYVRAHATADDLHVTYAGSCPGAIDASIDQRMSPTELLVAISSRGIDISAQPTVFENIIPPDRRRFFSMGAGMPDVQKLWEAAAFRIAQPSDVDLSVGVAQLLLSEERVLIDMAPLVGCVCRADAATADPAALLRAPSPVVRDGVIDVTRSAPVFPERHSDPRTEPLDSIRVVERQPDPFPLTPARRNSPRPMLRRQASWRRSSPRAGVVLPRASASAVMVPESLALALLRRPSVRIAIAAAAMAAMVMLGMWIGRQREPTASDPAPPEVQRADVPHGPVLPRPPR